MEKKKARPSWYQQQATNQPYAPPLSGEQSSLSSSVREKFYPEITPQAKDQNFTEGSKQDVSLLTPVDVGADGLEYPADDDGEYDEIGPMGLGAGHYMISENDDVKSQRLVHIADLHEQQSCIPARSE